MEKRPEFDVDKYQFTADEETQNAALDKVLNQGVHEKKKNPLFSALDWYDRNVDKPTVGIFTGALLTPLWWTDASKKFKENFGEAFDEADQNIFGRVQTASRTAYEETKLPQFVKGTLEVINPGDPINYILPVGKLIKAGAKGGVAFALRAGAGHGVDDATALAQRLGVDVTERVSNITVGTTDLLKRASRKLRGGSWQTEAEALTQIKVGREAMTLEEVDLPDPTKAFDDLESPRGLDSMFYPLLDPDRIFLNELDVQRALITKQKSAGAARSADELTDVEKAEVARIDGLLDTYNRKYGWFYDGKISSRASPLYWAGKTLRGIGSRVIVPSWFAQGRLTRAAQIKNKQDLISDSTATIVDARMSFHSTRGGRFVSAYAQEGGIQGTKKRIRNALGRAIHGPPDWEDEIMRRRPGSHPYEIFRNEVEDALAAIGVDLGDLLTDDIMVTGETLAKMASALGAIEANALVLQRRLTGQEYFELRRLAAIRSATYSATEDLSKALSTVAKNRRKLTRVEQGERILEKLDGEPDAVILRDGFKINVYTLGDPANPLGVYGSDPLFGLRISWDPLAGKQLLGLPDDIDQSVLPRAFWEQHYELPSGKVAEEAVFVKTNNNMIANLNGVEFHELRPELHSDVALRERFFLRYRQAESLGLLDEAGDITEEGKVLDEVFTWLNDDQMDYYRKYFDLQEALVGILDKHKIYDLEDLDQIRSYMARIAVAVENGTYLKDDHSILSQPGSRVGGKPTFERPRQGRLEENLKRGVIYHDTAQTAAQFTKQVLRRVTHEQLMHHFADHVIYDGGTAAYLAKQHQIGREGLVRLGKELVDQVSTTEGRLQLIQDEEELASKMYRLRRLGEQVGHRAGLSATDYHNQWQKIKADTETDITRLIDTINNPKGQRLVYRRPGESGERYKYQTVKQQTDLADRLRTRVQRSARTVWLEKDETGYESIRLYKTEDVDDLIERLGDPMPENTEWIWLSNPETSKRVDWKGEYTKETVNLNISDFEFSGVNEAGIQFLTDLRGFAIRHSVRGTRGKSAVTEIGQGTTRRLRDDDLDVVNDMWAFMREKNLIAPTDQTAQAMADRIARTIKDTGIALNEAVRKEMVELIKRNQSNEIQAAFRGDLANVVMQDILRIKKSRRTDLSRSDGILQYIYDLTEQIDTAVIVRAEEVTKAITNFQQTAMRQASDAAVISRNIAEGTARIAQDRTVQLSGGEIPRIFQPETSNEVLDLYGRRVGRRVTGGYYSRAEGPRNPHGDIRDTLAMPVGARGPGEVPESVKIVHGLDPRRVPGLAAEGMFYTREAAAEINKMGPADNPITQLISGAEAASNSLRHLTVTYDIGAYMIQGIILLAFRPDLFARTIAHTIPTMTDPTWVRRYIAERPETMVEMANHGMPLLTARYEDFLSLGQQHRSLREPRNPGNLFASARDTFLNASESAPLGRPVMRAGIREEGGVTRLGQAIRTTTLGSAASIGDITRRAEALYNSTGLVARTLMWEALRDTWVRNGSSLDELSQWLQHATGFIDLGGAGMSEGQQSFERAAVFFAPRYTRATMAAVGDAFKGGMTGMQAKKTMAALVAAPVVYHWTLASALQQEPKLDPRPYSEGGDGSEFLTVNIAGQNIGVGTMWLQLVRLMGAVGTNDWSDLDNFVKPDVRNNPFARFWRNRIPPGVGATLSITQGLFTGKTFIGEPLETTIDAGREVLSSASPFWLDAAVLQGGPIHHRLFAGSTELVGARVFPMSKYEKLDIERNLAARQRFDKPWIALDALQKRRLVQDQGSGRIEELTEELNDSVPLASAGKDGDLGDVTDLYFNIREAADKTWRSRVNDLEKGVDTGKMDLVGYRKRLRIHNTTRRNQVDVLDNDLFTAVREALKESRNRNDGVFPAGDIAYYDYLERVIWNDNLDKKNGEYDFDLRNTLDEEFTAVWGDDALPYVLERFKAARETRDWKYPMLVEELYYAREQYSWYWSDVPGVVIGQSPQSAYKAELYDVYADANETDQARMKAENRLLYDLVETIEGTRRKIRERNRDLDIFLFRWGFTDTLRHIENQNLDTDELRFSRMVGPPYPQSLTVTLPTRASQ